MPFTSYAQMTFLRENHPAIYQRWVRKYGKYTGNKLRADTVANHSAAQRTKQGSKNA